MTIDISSILLAFIVCIPSGLVGLIFWIFEKKIEKREKLKEQQRESRQKEQDERERKRQEHEFMTWQTINASLALSEATARAVQRIPDAKCNGDMKYALDYAADIKHKQRDFIEKEGISEIYKQQMYFF